MVIKAQYDDDVGYSSKSRLKIVIPYDDRGNVVEFYDECHAARRELKADLFDRLSSNRAPAKVTWEGAHIGGIKHYVMYAYAEEHDIVFKEILRRLADRLNNAEV